MMTLRDSVFIIADIEGTSGCWNYRASQFKTPEWAAACVEMSKDMNAVVTALFNAGVQNVFIKDFHRTGYNLLPELIDQRASIIHGYRRGPVPGIGRTFGAKALMMIGMHAASGSNGFLAHTLTSRIKKLEVNGRLVCEAEFFASSVAPEGLRPVFFSGCPVACAQARDVLRGIQTCAIEKRGSERRFDREAWRKILAASAAGSLENRSSAPYRPDVPCHALVTMRDGEEAARTMARRWGFDASGDTLQIPAQSIDELYLSLIRLCYFTPFIERILPLGLMVFNAMGRAGLTWVRHTAKSRSRFNN